MYTIDLTSSFLNFNVLLLLYLEPVSFGAFFFFAFLYSHIFSKLSCDFFFDFLIV